MDVDTSTFQCGGEKAISNTESLRMQVKVFHLKEERGKTKKSVFAQLRAHKY